MLTDSQIMNSLTLFAYNSAEFLREVSKKGTSSDIEFFERKSDDLILTIVNPNRYPEKISSLTDSIFPSDVALVNVTQLNRDLGEVIVGLDLMGPDTGFITFDDPNMIDQVKQVIRGTRLEKYVISEKPPMELVEDISAIRTKKSNSNPCVVIDHFFQVRGVGTVALGFVMSGMIRKHQEMEISYLNRKAQIRSIQMHDVDVDEAGPSSRVGLALKNVDSEELQRGMMLTEVPLNKFDSIVSSIAYHKSVRKVPENIFEAFISDAMRYQRGSYDGQTLTLDSTLQTNQKFMTLASNMLSPRLFGKIRLS